ncbi:hypothetical protein E3N88_35762 [Mikania micrantha]|uniref:C3H1-type domain-containing protein n=1 Tax=Mikania micrantha TaxID=192012 RepID=A0A5N6M278_9ASTR|nr:hypothetical protein E3N88_35762 [Mikania micrantha]
MSHHQISGDNNGGSNNFPGQNESKYKSQTKNKQSRNPEVDKNPQMSTSFGQRSTPSSLPVNTGATPIFYKTRMCQKFADGNCHNGDKCRYAHGPKDLHEPPPNWQELLKDNRGGDWNDDEKIIQRMRICRMFYNGNQCPNGENCSFLHQSPDRFKIQKANDNVKSGETFMIKIETVVEHGQRKGMAELAGSSSVAANKLTSPIATEPLATCSASNVHLVAPRIGRGFLKLANKKLVGIYADWIDDGDYLNYP